MKHLILLCTLCTIPFIATAEPVDVYILSGQSNMQGSGNLTEISPGQRTRIPLAQYWNGKAFEPLTPGTTITSHSAERFGPELQFARRLAASSNDNPFYIIKYHASGQPLDHGLHGQEWQGDTTGPKRSTFYAGISDTDPHMGTRYRGLLNTTRAALADLDKRKIKYTVRGFLWMQGEADGKHEIPAKRYGQNLQHLHERLYADLKIPLSPMIYGQVLPHTPPAPRFTHQIEVRQSQANLHHASGHADSYTWAHMISTDTIPLRKDTVHYSSTGLIDLGDDFYEAITKVNTK